MTQLAEKRIAILLAVYNGEAWLKDQLDSLFWQSHQNWQLFVRDDGSQDGSVELIQSRCAGDPRITWLPSEGRSTGSASGNFMAVLQQLDLSAFDYVAFCDQDDIWAPQKLTAAISRMLQHQAEAYSSDLIAFDNGRKSSSYISKGADQQTFDYLFQSASAGCTYVITRRAAGLICQQLRFDAQGLVAQMSHDWLIYAVCRSHGLRWTHEAFAQVFYRQHAANVYGANSRWGGLIKRLKMVNSGWYRRQILWQGQLLAQSQDEVAILERIRRFSVLDRFWLAARSRSFRRDRREALWLKLLFLSGLL